MEQRGNVFVPVVRPEGMTKVRVGRRPQRHAVISSGPQKIGKIFEGIAIDFIKLIRREMLR
jgi:hypothetical protein